MIRDKQKELIVTDIPKMVKFPGHHEASSIYLNSSIFPEVKITIDADEVSKLVNSEVAELHTHNVPEVYLAISENRGEMVFEITLNKDTYVVESPMAVFIPAGVKHKYKTLRAGKKGSYLLGILLDYTLRP